VRCFVLSAVSGANERVVLFCLRRVWRHVWCECACCFFCRPNVRVVCLSVRVVCLSGANVRVACRFVLVVSWCCLVLFCVLFCLVCVWRVVLCSRTTSTVLCSRTTSTVCG
jgi:hypothetical protein